MSTTIYDLDIKDMRKAIQSFHKTLYGRTVFFFAYIISFALFVTFAIMMIIGEMMQSSELVALAGRFFGAFAVTFILGNIYFYSELRKYVAAGKFKK